MAPEEVKSCLDAYNFNISRAAKELGVSRHTLNRFIKKHGWKRPNKKLVQF